MKPLLCIALAVGFNTGVLSVSEDMGTVTGQLSVGILDDIVTEQEVDFIITYVEASKVIIIIISAMT